MGVSRHLPQLLLYRSLHHPDQLQHSRILAVDMKIAYQPYVHMLFCWSSQHQISAYPYSFYLTMQCLLSPHYDYSRVNVISNQRNIIKRTIWLAHPQGQSISPKSAKHDVKDQLLIDLSVVKACKKTDRALPPLFSVSNAGLGFWSDGISLCCCAWRGALDLAIENV